MENGACNTPVEISSAVPGSCLIAISLYYMGKAVYARTEKSLVDHVLRTPKNKSEQEKQERRAARPNLALVQSFENQESTVKRL